MKVLVCGSRDWAEEHVVYKRLAELPDDTHFIHGGAKGPDLWAEKFALFWEMPVTRFPANWLLHGKKAGILRNIQMLDEKPDLVIAFWDGQSNGTAHTVSEARKRGIPVDVIE